MTARLFVGPYYGEFGHEITFAGIARARARDYRRVTVCTRPARQALYADFASDFVPHDIVCEGMCEKSTHTTVPNAGKVRSYIPGDGCDILEPVEYFGRRATEWHQFGTRRAEFADAVVFHARSRPHVPARNWPVRNWHCLARAMFADGLAGRIICIGTRKNALLAEGCLDARGTDLPTQMDILASARMAVGMSSGPMHLAAHCGCPHVVWVGGGTAERVRTGGRYRGSWNPFQTPVRVIEVGSWQPSLGDVLNAVREFGKEIA